MENFRSMQNEIKSALSEERFEIFLQPIYSVQEQKFVSAEALVRMRSNDGSIIMPNKFIPIAEMSGQIEQIGERVFELVCKLIHDHDITSIGLQYIEVNLSVVQCENPDLAPKFFRIMHRYGIDAKKINLEITESGAIKQKDILLENMEYLRKYGCSFSLDDFGTGESNLDYILNMPVDIVKFDRTMVNAYFKSEKARIMFESVTDMIKRLGMQIVAEGVEEQPQLEKLSKLGKNIANSRPFDRWAAVCVSSVIYAFGIEVVMRKSVPCKLLPLSTGLAIIAIRVNGNTAARQEFSPYLDIFRRHELYKVFHDYINAVLMEVAVIAKAEKIELQRLALHHYLIGNV